MLDRIDVDTTDRVALLVRGVLQRRGIVGPVEHDGDLRAAGLSSLDIVNLMLTVESEFAVAIPERDMTPANFRSIARIAALLRDLVPSVAD